jgi:hypothetical protein
MSSCLAQSQCPGGSRRRGGRSATLELVATFPDNYSGNEDGKLAELGPRRTVEPKEIEDEAD